MQDYWAMRKAIGSPPVINCDDTSPEELIADHQYWDYVMKCVEYMAAKYKSADPEDCGYYDALVLDCVNDLELRAKYNKKAAEGAFSLSSLNIQRKIRGLPLVGVLNEQSR